GFLATSGPRREARWKPVSVGFGDDAAWRPASVGAAELPVVPARDPLGTDPDDDPLPGLAAHRLAKALRRAGRVVLRMDVLEHVEDLLLVLLDGRAPADEKALQLFVGSAALDEQRAAGITPEIQ